MEAAAIGVPTAGYQNSVSCTDYDGNGEANLAVDTVVESRSTIEKVGDILWLHSDQSV